MNFAWFLVYFVSAIAVYVIAEVFYIFYPLNMVPAGVFFGAVLFWMRRK